MEARIMSVTFNGSEQVVKVGYFDAEGNQKHMKTYYLKDGQEVESLYPAFVDDIADLEAGFAAADAKKDLIDKPIDLTGVPSGRAESKKKFEAQAEKERIEREARIKEQEEKAAAEEVTPEN